VFITDQGYEVFGNIKHTEENFKDFRDLIKDAGGVFLGIR
jgi:hypothetical protein